jgi:hypothetical protein
MKAKTIPESIKDYFRYENGKLIRVKKTQANCKIGEAGYPNSRGYLTIGFKGKKHFVHRVIWFIVKGKQPPPTLDHVNNNITDNRIENLREANTAQNMHNASLRKDNKSGVKGVFWLEKRKRWVAKISHNKKNIFLGNFKHLIDAEEAVQQARKELHGDFANNG